MIRAALLCSLVACIPPTYVQDEGPFAFAAGDATALLSGCGSPVNVGFLYCRLAEGWEPTGEVRVVVPPTKCGLDSCARVVVFRPDGGRAVDLALPVGASYFAIPWTSLLGKAPIDGTARGFWPVVLQWVWRNGDGMLEQGFAEGEIRVRVTKMSYTPLGAEAARWRWQLGRYEFRVTEKGRAYVEDVGSPVMAPKLPAKAALR